MRDLIRETPHYEQIAKRWESASKMRQWISEKKKNLIEKIKKEVELEFQKKKEEDKKREQETAKDKKDTEEKKDHEESKDNEEKKEEVV